MLTGANLYSSRGLDPLERNNRPAITPGAPNAIIQKIIELDIVEKNLIASLREMMGLPVYLDGASVGDRTANKLAEGQRAASTNVTGFIVKGHNQLMEDALNYICKLAWEDVVAEDPEDAQDYSFTLTLGNSCVG